MCAAFVGFQPLESTLNSQRLRIKLSIIFGIRIRLSTITY